MIPQTTPSVDSTAPHSDSSLPPYVRQLAELHDAHRKEFKSIIGELPLCPDDRVLDVACGDGFYTALLGDRVPRGSVTGIDVSTEILERMARGERFSAVNIETALDGSFVYEFDGAEAFA